MTNNSPDYVIQRPGASRIQTAVMRYRNRLRRRRAEMLLREFSLNETTRILDLGGWNGAHIHAILQGCTVTPSNVFVADIDAMAVRQASERHGYTPVVIPDAGPLPFGDAHFDVVFCSSVIEHVTIPKSQVWNMVCGREFRNIAQVRQAEFAAEIRRIGKGYFVQAPYRWSLIESHSWLPLVGYLPRPIQMAVLRFTNRFWIKQTTPDFYLPDEREMKAYFPDGRIVRERMLGFTKSLVVIRSNRQ